MWRERAKRLKAHEMIQGCYALLLVHGGVGAFHFGSDLVSGTDLDQWTDADSRTAVCGCLPCGAALQELGPEWEQTALRGLGRVDGATAFDQEMALFLLRFAEPKEVAGAINVTALKFRRGEVEVAGGPAEVLLGEVDIALDVAAADAPALARELQALHAGQDNLKYGGCAGGRGGFILDCKVRRL